MQEKFEEYVLWKSPSDQVKLLIFSVWPIKWQIFWITDENITKLISEMESQVKNGQKTTPNPATEQPPPQEVGPWILAQEVKNIQTGEHCKAFVQPSPLSPVLQCMICKPVRKVEIRTNQFERHVNGKPHMEQMKKFSIVESIWFDSLQYLEIMQFSFFGFDLKIKLSHKRKL